MDVNVAIESAREQAKEMLRQEFGIASAFVRVPDLARVLGLAECTIYQAMREGRFFLPHRMLLSSPAVKLDDLVTWYCGEWRAPEPSNEHRQEADRQDRASEIRAAVVSAALARMRR